MRPVLPSICALVLAGVASAAAAQVHRCANTNVYTDKPCDGASPVDLRANIMDAGPRQIPPDPPPAPAIIMPLPPKPAQTSSGDLWDRRDAAESEYRRRTGPYTP